MVLLLLIDMGGIRGVTGYADHAIIVIVLTILRNGYGYLGLLDAMFDSQSSALPVTPLDKYSTT